MKQIQLSILLIALTLLGSCDTTTYSHNNPLSYRNEIPFFQITPYIPYNKILNRIDYGIIKYQNPDKDSIYIRGAFYDNDKFRDVGNLYINSMTVNEVRADDLFNINQLIEGFIEFGTAYFSVYDTALTNQNLEIATTGNEIPYFKANIEALKSELSVLNVTELNNISKSKGFVIKTNDIGFDEARIKIYNSNNNFIFYTSFDSVLNIAPEKLKDIPSGEYSIECLKGHYALDTLPNNEPIIFNIYSSYTFQSNIK